MNLIIADVETKADKPLLVVVDGLDKIPRTDQANLIFLDSRALRGPACNIIYTVPMLIYNHPLFNELEDECESYFLPNVKLYEMSSDSKQYKRGYEELQQIVDKRLKLFNLVVDDVFQKDALNMLIEKSGGVVRWFILMIRDAVKSAKRMDLDIVDRDAARKAVDRRAQKLTARLTREAITELRLVRKEKIPSGDKAASVLINSLLIVAYRNGDTWFDAHPLIWNKL